jgi:ABC-type transporter Mla subunit MlaD
MALLHLRDGLRAVLSGDAAPGRLKTAGGETVDEVLYVMQEVQQIGGGGLEWIVVVTLALVELWIFLRVLRTARAINDKVERGNAIVAAADEVRQSQDPVATLDRLTQDSHLSVCWQSLKTLARFPAPDLSPVWRASRVPFDLALQQIRPAPNQALLCGLLATVASLVWAFWDMGGTLKAGTHGQDPGALADSIAPYLSRFRAAFLSTGLGVSFAILAASQNAKAHRLVDGYLGNVESFLLNTCAPLAIPPSMEHSLERIQVALETANAQAQETAKYMRVAAVSIARQVANMREATASAIASYQKISSEIQEGASRLRENVTELGNVQRAVQSGYDQLFTQQKAAMDVFLQTAEKVQQMLVKHTTVTLSALDTTGQKFDAASTRFVEASADFRTMSEQIGFEAYNKLEEWSSRFHEALKKQAEDLELVDARLSEVASSVRDMMERMNPQLLHTEDWAKVREVLDNGSAAVSMFLEAAEQMQKQLEYQRAQFAAICDSFIKELRSVAQLPRTVSDASEELAANVARHSNTLSLLATRMESLGRLLENLRPTEDTPRPKDQQSVAIGPDGGHSKAARKTSTDSLSERRPDAHPVSAHRPRGARHGSPDETIPELLHYENQAVVTTDRKGDGKRRAEGSLSLPSATEPPHAAEPVDLPEQPTHGPASSDTTESHDA